MVWPDRRNSSHRRPLIHRNSASSIRMPLSHRNSTSSIHGHPKRDSIDPETGRRDATAAAHNTAGLSRGNSAAARPVVTVRRSDSTRFVEHGGVYPPASPRNGLKRQQSVRFAGPNAVPRRQSLVRRQSQEPVHSQQRPFSHTRGKGSTSTLRPRALTNESAVPAEYRPMSRSSSIGKSSLRASGKGGNGADSFVTALAESAVYDEYYAITREDDVASTPSSYRRIRRSKSMFSPGKTKSVMSSAKDRGSIQYSNGSPSPRALRRSQSFMHRGATGLKFQKSMSFLRGGKERQKVGIGTEDRDVAVAMARDKFLRQHEQQRLKEQPSFLFRANKRREEHSSKPFRKSVRSGSGNSASFGKPVSSEDQQFPSRDDGSKTLKSKARQASKSFRKKIKGLFKRGSGESEEATIPDQQVTAYETHVVEVPPFPSTASDGSHGTPYADIPCPTPNQIYQVATRVGSLHAISSTQQLRSRTGSVQSLRSDGSGTASNCSKSRVTSWTSTNDTVTSATSRHAQLERERQRLSIIQENGTHVSSSTFQRQPLRNQFSAYPLMERGKKQASKGVITQPVDSQRVYSALMRRLDENSPQYLTEKQVQRQASEESFDIPARNGSLRHGQTKDTPSTIRAVPPSAAASSTSLQSDDGAKSLQRLFQPHQPNTSDDVFSPQKDTPIPPSYNDNTLETHRRKASGSVSNSISSQSTLIIKKPPSYSAFPTRSEPGDDSAFFTPQQIADRNEGGRLPLASSRESKSKSSAVLRESKSTFFPSKMGQGIGRTTSPYRRALAVSDWKPDWKSDYNSSSITAAKSPARTVVPENTNNKSGDNVGASAHQRNSGHTIYSESVYSRTTGEEPADFDCQEAEDLPSRPDRRGDGSGTATLIEREVYRPTHHRPSPFEPLNKDQIQHRLASSAGSVEWKKWMSAEVAALEPEIVSMVPSMPHDGESFAGGGGGLGVGVGVGHVREKAQISDDGEGVVQMKVPVAVQPLGILQQAQYGQGGSSYSLRVPPPPHEPQRPKSILKKTRSQTSMSTVFTDAHERMERIPPPLPARERFPLRETVSRTSLRSNSSVGTTNTVTKTRNRGASGTVRQFLNPKASSDTLRGDGGKLVKRNASGAGFGHGRGVNGNGVSPGGLGVAVERQFGSAGSRSRSNVGSTTKFEAWEREREKGNENLNPSGVARFQAQVQGLVNGEGGGGNGGGMAGDRMAGKGKEVQAEVMGSKRMVDLFLSSRRRRVAGSEDSGAAFL